MKSIFFIADKNRDEVSSAILKLAGSIGEEETKAFSPSNFANTGTYGGYVSRGNEISSYSYCMSAEEEKLVREWPKIRTLNNDG